MVTYSAVARVSKSASTGPPGSTLGCNADHGHPPLIPAPLGINHLVAARCAGLRELLAGWNPDEHPELRELIDKLGRDLVSQIPTPVPAAT
jgi:hypothetical protein